MSVAEILLRKGYFPSQLPPPFTTTTLASRFAGLKLPVDIKAVPPTRGEFFSAARIGHHRRPITIPNPINQVYLAREIEKSWKKLEKHFDRSSISLSNPTISEEGNRAIQIAPLSELFEKRTLFSSGFRFVLRTDVSRFFPTLYTHTIPWALHGKHTAKNKRKDFSDAFYGNRIDSLTQKCQEGQTLGIPIGPDTSHIIGEILLSSVDARLSEFLGPRLVGYRHVDDYFLCFNTYQEAESTLTELGKALRDYELDLNVSKTRIVSIDNLVEDFWVGQIRASELSEDPTKQRREIHEFFMNAFKLSRELSDESVLKYALRRFTDFLVHEDNWDVYESYLLRMALTQSNTVQTIVRILVEHKNKDFPIGIPNIKRICEALISRGADYGHHTEVAWALWLAIEFNISLEGSLLAKLQLMDSSICALLTLHCVELDLLPGRFNFGSAAGLFSESGLKGSSWLLVYEATRKGWHSFPKKFLQDDQYFGLLSKADISFYDSTRRLSEDDFEDTYTG